jgi:hypothetical protein
MKKINFIIILASVMLTGACNKESVIEGTIVAPTVVVLNKSISFYTLLPPAISLSIGGNTVPFQMQGFLGRFIAGATNVTSANDSVRINSVNIQTVGFTIGGTAGTNGLSVVIKYNKGNEIPLNIFYTGGYFMFAKKTPPYSNPYTSINSLIVLNGGNSFTPQFSLNSDGYMAFKYSTTTGPSAINYYGWIHVIIGQNEVTLDKYAYQKDFPIKIGQEE